MINQLLPQQIDNRYQGSKIALWLFAAVLVLRVGIGIGTIFNGKVAASQADGIPLETFSPAAAQAFLSLFAAWGMAQTVLGSVGILALVRYRAMVPLLFAAFLVEWLGRKLIFHVLPIVKRPGTHPGFAMNLFLLALMAVGLVLSLWNPGGRSAAE